MRLAMKLGLREWCSIHSIPGGEVDGGGSDLLLEGQDRRSVWRGYWWVESRSGGVEHTDFVQWSSAVLGRSRAP